MSSTRGELIFADNTTGEPLVSFHRNTSTLTVYRRVGEYPGARLVLESGAAKLVTDVRECEIASLVDALAPLSLPTQAAVAKARNTQHTYIVSHIALLRFAKGGELRVGIAEARGVRKVRVSTRRCETVRSVDIAPELIDTLIAALHEAKARLRADVGRAAE